MRDKPDIVEVIGARVDLRRTGREFVGLCPFHADRHASLYVNPDKQVFLCRACQAAGDVFTFIMMADGLTFPQARKALGIEGRKCRPKLTQKRKRAAELAAAWINEQRAKLNVLIADRMEQRDLADEAGAFDLAEAFDREITLLRNFCDALAYPRGAAELLAVRASIGKITDEVAI